MARIDKAWIVVRGIAGTALTGCIGVYFAGSGSVLPAGTGAGSAADGVVCIPGTVAAGRPVGVLQRGEIVEFGGSVGSPYYSGVGGTLSLTTTNATLVGKTVEGDRLIVKM
jgi:hypothetical protein